MDESSLNIIQKSIISLQPVKQIHKKNLLKVFEESRPDLEWINGVSEEHKSNIIAQQFTIEQEQLITVYPEAEINIVMLGEKPIGRIYIYYGENVDRILEIGLLEAYRGLGIGGSIVTKVIEKAEEKGKAVSLQVAWFNQGAYKFYEKLGFQVVGNNGVFYEMKYSQ